MASPITYIGICHNPETNEAFVTIKPPLTEAEVEQSLRVPPGSGIFMNTINDAPYVMGRDQTFVIQTGEPHAITLVSVGNQDAGPSTSAFRSPESLEPSQTSIVRAKRRATNYAGWLAFSRGQRVTINPRITKTNLTTQSATD